jgi:hypothetical protein
LSTEEPPSSHALVTCAKSSIADRSLCSTPKPSFRSKSFERNTVSTSISATGLSIPSTRDHHRAQPSAASRPHCEGHYARGEVQRRCDRNQICRQAAFEREFSMLLDTDHEFPANGKYNRLNRLYRTNTRGWAIGEWIHITPLCDQKGGKTQ